MAEYVPVEFDPFAPKVASAGGLEEKTPPAPAGKPVDFDTFAPASGGAPASAPDIGYTGAFAEGAKRGVTANWWDELSGVYHASGINKLLNAIPEGPRAAILQHLASNPLTAPGIAASHALHMPSLWPKSPPPQPPAASCV